MKALNPVIWQRVEAVALFVASVVSIKYTGQSWWWLTAILVPDIFMIGYIKSTKLGAFTYNLGHTVVLPLTLLTLGLNSHKSLFIVWACIWLAHIGMDRMLGYGLKENDSFKHTHLGNL